MASSISGTTNDFDKVIAQPYMRGVIAELVDQAEMIKRVYHGWAVPAYGPAPTARVALGRRHGDAGLLAL